MSRPIPSPAASSAACATPATACASSPAGCPAPILVAAGWRVPITVAEEHGVVPDAIIWAALDCATGWAHFQPGESALLGRLTARIHRRVYPGGTYSVVARATGREGRKLFGDQCRLRGRRHPGRLGPSRLDRSGIGLPEAGRGVRPA